MRVRALECLRRAPPAEFTIGRRQSPEGRCEQLGGRFEANRGAPPRYESCLRTRRRPDTRRRPFPSRPPRGAPTPPSGLDRGGISSMYFIPSSCSQWSRMDERATRKATSVPRSVEVAGLEEAAAPRSPPCTGEMSPHTYKIHELDRRKHVLSIFGGRQARSISSDALWRGSVVSGPLSISIVRQAGEHGSGQTTGWRTVADRMTMRVSVCAPPPLRRICRTVWFRSSASLQATRIR